MNKINKIVWFIKRYKIECSFWSKFILCIQWLDWTFIKCIFKKFGVRNCIEDGHIYLALNFGITIIGILFSPAQLTYKITILGVGFELDILNKEKILCHNVLQYIK